MIPGGRLTLETGVPVSSSDQTAKTTIYYTPFRHGYVPLYNGTTWYTASFSELSQALSNNTTSPAAAAASTVYDLFVWNNAGTITLSRGPAYAVSTAGSTSRGTGAGTTELEMVNGRRVNKYAITNGPAAQRGLYVGTIATDANGGNGQLNVMIAPSAASGGAANRVDIWNEYNQVDIISINRDSADSWNYSTATWRSANNSTSNRITVVTGQPTAVSARATNISSNASTIQNRVGIGLNATNAFAGFPASYKTSGTVESVSCEYAGVLSGLNYLQRLEYAEAGGTSAWVGDNGSATDYQSGISARWAY
jgi:hypothetical protein